MMSKERPQLRLERYSYSEKTTIGKLYAWNEPLQKYDFFGHTLEDTARPYGVKLKHHTAIPATNPGEPYKISVRDSGRFGTTGVIYTAREGEVYILENGGTRFTYILFHGGNNVSHTSGCVLIASNYINKDIIQGSLKEELTKKIKEYMISCDVYMEVINLPQKE